MGHRHLYLIRHGQTHLNRDKRFRGMTDASLTDTGRAEVRGAAGLLAGADIGLIHTSPLPRAVETARIVARRTGSKVLMDDSFVDIDYGSWQGLTVDEVREKFGEEQMEKWISDPGNFHFPDGESMQEVLERVAPALERVVEGRAPGNVAVVSHLAVLKTCFLACMGLSFEWFWRIDLDNGSVSRFAHTDQGSFVLESWNVAETALD